MRQNGLELGPRCVDSALATVELVGKLTEEVEQPSVVIDAGTCPDGARMVLVCDLVALVSVG